MTARTTVVETVTVAVDRRCMIAIMLLCTDQYGPVSWIWSQGVRYCLELELAVAGTIYLYVEETEQRDGKLKTGPVGRPLS